MPNGHATYEDLEKLATAIPAQGAAARGGNPIQQFCTFWPLIKKVLEMVKHLFPKNVREKIEAAIKVCDTLCGA